MNSPVERPPSDFHLPDDAFADIFVLDQASLTEAAALKPFAPFQAGEHMSPDEGVQSFASDDGWHWQDAALIAVERASRDGTNPEYAIGAVDLYANARTGDLGGSYLEIGTFDDVDHAAKFYHDLQTDIDTRMLLPFQLVDFAADAAKARGIESPAWRSARPAEYAAYEAMRNLDTVPMPDLPPADFVFGAPEVPSTHPALDALREIGLSSDGFDPMGNTPPFVDPESGTSYWIGIFQPDKDDPSNCVASILSVGRNPDTGGTEAQLAPCAQGDWEHANQAAEHLLGAIEKGGIDRCFDLADGMALASGQRDLWQNAQGIALEADTARELADLASHPLEINR